MGLQSYFTGKSIPAFIFLADSTLSDFRLLDNDGHLTAASTLIYESENCGLGPAVYVKLKGTACFTAPNSKHRAHDCVA